MIGISDLEFEAILNRIERGEATPTDVQVLRDMRQLRPIIHALLAACKLAKQYLDALRIESGIGNVMYDFEKVAFEQVDQALIAAIEQAKGGQ